MDTNNLFDQVTEITKAQGYDILATEVVKLKTENVTLTEQFIEITRLSVELKADNTILNEQVKEYNKLFEDYLMESNKRKLENDSLKEQNKVLKEALTDLLADYVSFTKVDMGENSWMNTVSHNAKEALNQVNSH